jgi:hypothetical protein
MLAVVTVPACGASPGQHKRAAATTAQPDSLLGFMGPPESCCRYLASRPATRGIREGERNNGRPPARYLFELRQPESTPSPGRVATSGRRKACIRDWNQYGRRQQSAQEAWGQALFEPELDPGVFEAIWETLKSSHGELGRIPRPADAYLEAVARQDNSEAHARGEGGAARRSSAGGGRGVAGDDFWVDFGEPREGATPTGPEPTERRN